MSRVKLITGLLAGLVVTWLIAPQVFGAFTSIREKVIRAELPAGGLELRVPIAADAAIANLRPPFAAIARVRNNATQPLVLRIAMDGREICSAEIPGGRAQRVDCAVASGWTAAESHEVLFSGSQPEFTIEYLELATHYGALTPGPRNLIVVPPGFAAFQRAPAWHVLLIATFLVLSVWSTRDARMSRPIATMHLAASSVVALVMGAVIASRFVGPYAVLIGHTFLEKLLLIAALPWIWFGAQWVWRALSRPRVAPLAKVAGAGLIVGAVFCSLAAHQIEEKYSGNPSGLLLVSHFFFDRSPMATAPDNVARNLVFAEGNGYDGQFFYYMTFDPFLREFRQEPSRYGAFIDAPPYRYGRIGFSLLAKAISGDTSSRYPITMVALVLGSLAMCGVLLAAIARHHGLSPWFGLLIAIVPGFRQSVDGTLPEPLAIAFILGAYLCLIRERWLGCGVLLGLSMLVRETGGVFVLAMAGGLLVSGRWRHGFLVALMAFVPVVLWKTFVGWVFWTNSGLASVMTAPNDVGVPFAGVAELWARIGRGEYFPAFQELARAGLIYPVLTTAAAGLALVTAIRKPSAVAMAAVGYALLTITFNYEGVWLHVDNAQRLTIDLFVALALVSVQRFGDRRGLPKAFGIFWAATAVYVLFGAFQASTNRAAILDLIPRDLWPPFF